MEAMFVLSLSVRGLECSFHFDIFYCSYSLNRVQKYEDFLNSPNFLHFLAKTFAIFDEFL